MRPGGGFCGCARSRAREESSNLREGVAHLWRLFLAGRWAVRKDRREGIWGTRSKGSEKCGHRRSATGTEKRQRQSRVFVRLLSSEADGPRQGQSQDVVRAAKPRQENDYGAQSRNRRPRSG